MSLPKSLANIDDSGCGMLARVSRELARMEKRKLGIVDDCVDGWCDRKLRLADSDFPIGLPQTRSPALSAPREALVGLAALLVIALSSLSQLEQKY
jgi:hypothetical protein